MQNKIILIKTLFRLGLYNIFLVLKYRFKMSSSPTFIDITTNNENFLTAPLEILEQGANNLKVCQKYHLFGYIISDHLDLPNWHVNVLNGSCSDNSSVPWNKIKDFDGQLGDIKGVWEVSRLGHLIPIAQAVVLGSTKHLEILNQHLLDWTSMNKPYFGVNWKCGQEASIRVMHLALIVLLLKQTHNTTPALLSFIKSHLIRISPTILYAVAQDNNHGTSEAAALYIGGSWLELNGDTEGAKWQKQGLKWLENRATKLIENDGCFSQYSVTYHRVMIDTYSLVEVWRRKHDLHCFSKRLYTKLAAASNWLFYFTDAITGDAPNMGANDGARLIPLTGTDYRDFRPSVQLASVLFIKKAAYDFSGDFNIPLNWLELDIPTQFLASKTSKDFMNGGYAFLTTANASLYFNYPMFRFRPSQCDALHIDFWLNGHNIFRDGGTFSYNAGQKYIDYYGGVKSHNTVEFDSHDQMPRLSRFLLGDWLKTSIKKELIVTNKEQTITAGYKDRFGCQHARTIILQSSSLVIQDAISGFNNRAVLRFRLAPADWNLIGNSISSELCTINFSADITIKRIELTRGFESRYYYQESEIPVLEIEVNESGILTTEVKF